MTRLGMVFEDRRSLVNVVRFVTSILAVLAAVVVAALVGQAIAREHVLLLIAMFGILAGLLAVRNLFPLLLGLVFLVPIEGLVVYRGVSLIRYYGPMVFAVWAFNHLLLRRPVKVRPPVWLFAAWMAWGLLPYLFGTTGSRPWLEYGPSVAQLIALLVVITDEVDSARKLQQMTVALGLGCVSLLGGAILFGEMHPLGFLWIRELGTRTSTTTLAYPLGVGMIILATNCVFGRGWQRLISAVLFLIGVYPLIAFSVRAAIVTLVSSLVLTVSFQRRRNISSLALGALLIILALLVGQFVLDIGELPAYTTERFRVDDLLYEHGTFLLRLHLWGQGIATWKRQPILGVGLGGFRFTTGAAPGLYSYTYMEAHNDYLRALVETGLVGASLFLSAIWLAVRSALRATSQARERDQVKLTTTVLGFTLLVAFGSFFHSLILMKIAWIIWGLAISAEDVLGPKQVTCASRPAISATGSDGIMK